MTDKRKAKDLTNQQVGQWTVLRQYKNNFRRIACDCRCSCGKEKIVAYKHLVAGDSKSCIRCASGFAHKHSRWKGYGEISGRRWREIMFNATNRHKHSFEISIEYAWDLFCKQGAKCALTGLPIRFKIHYKDTEPQTASLDRIDSEKGYIEGNLQWVHKDVNKMKNVFSQQRFVEICKLVASLGTKS